MLGISMFLVGAVLMLNGLMLLGAAGEKSVGIFNIMVGTFCTLMAFNNHVHAQQMGDHLATANTLLFAFTYFMVAANCLMKNDGKALGWFSLYVTAATVPNFLICFINRDVRMGVIWLAWGILWFLFFLSGALSNEKAAKMAPYASIITGILFTGIPGYMMLFGIW